LGLADTLGGQVSIEKAAAGNFTVRAGWAIAQNRALCNKHKWGKHCFSLCVQWGLFAVCVWAIVAMGAITWRDNKKEPSVYKPVFKA
jgi:hypothetical protein